MFDLGLITWKESRFKDGFIKGVVDENDARNR
jgi:hypothetical protein